MTTITYTENHHLASDEDGTNAHIALHLQGVTMRRAVQFVDAVLATARTYHPCVPATHYEPGGVTIERETVIRPQTSGPCVHLAPAGDDDPEEVAAIGLACGHPAGECPHLDNPDIVCPVRDACYATREADRVAPPPEVVDIWDSIKSKYPLPATMIDCPSCAGEGTTTDADGVIERCAYCDGAAAVTADRRDEYIQAGRHVKQLHTYEARPEPEFVEPEPEEAPIYTTPARPKGRAPAHVKEWTLAEDAAIRDATTAAESVTLYRSAVPDSGRSAAAIRTQWYKKVRPSLCEAPDPTPDFVGDDAPETQYEEFTVPHPVFRPGDSVKINHAPYCGLTGTISRYYEATENYLVSIDGLPDKIILRDTDLEVV